MYINTLYANHTHIYTHYTHYVYKYGIIYICIYIYICTSYVDIPTTRGSRPRLWIAGMAQGAPGQRLCLDAQRHAGGRTSAFS